VFERAPVDGAVIEQGRAVGLAVGGTLRRAGLVIGADGIESPVRRSLGLGSPARAGRSGGRRIGVRRHFQLAPGQAGPDRLEIFVGRGRELYVAPLPDGALLLAALCDRGVLSGGAEASLARWIAEEPLLAGWLDGATAISAPAGRAPVTRRARAGFGPGAVLLGDAAAATDPLTAGGIAHALLTAERLARFVPRALAEGDVWLGRFDRERRRLLRAHGWLTRALVFAARRPLLARATLGGMRAAPTLMRALLGVGGGLAIQPPELPSAAPSSATALASSSATAQNPTLSQRAGSR
jgi:flavin-dependent dehydrogenase